METLGSLRRTNYCGEVTLAMAGQEMTVCGSIARARDKGGIIFADLRDTTGILQLVFDEDTPKDVFAKAESLKSEYVVICRGKLRERAAKTDKIATGDVELYVSELRILSEAQTTPFELRDEINVNDDLRLRYRYLDLRRPSMHEPIVLRSKIMQIIRNYFCENHFTEIETPTLIKSTPEGARDYLVPSRVQPGHFYALPQSPQLYKQILMLSGFDRYFQLAHCYRDEDLRADRQPEFTQIDLEMSFVDMEDVLSIGEGYIKRVFKDAIGVDVPTPLPRITYNEAMNRYGSDKPDLRIDLEVQDVTDLIGGCSFQPFEGNTVKAVVVSNMTATRKQIDKLCADVEVVTANKVYWFKLDEKGEIAGGIAKFVKEQKDELVEKLGLKPNTFVGLTCGKKLAAQKTAGVLRRLVADLCPAHIDREKYEFCWIVDFPMYEIGEESGELEFCHNPFSMPNGGLEILQKAAAGEVDPLTITAYQYDLVCNGVELSSGAVRNHDPEIMIEAFKLVRLGEEDVKAKFPAMYNAFCYGAPPHAGIAPGVDRMVMLLAGAETIREVIPFPMNKNAQDVMMGAPGKVDQKQLDELHIACTKVEE